MSEILVNTIKKADGTGSITVPADSGTLLTSASSIPSSQITGTLGKALQVVNSTPLSGDFDTSSTSFTDVTGLTLTVTPTSSNSLIIVTLSCLFGGSTNLTNGRLKFVTPNGDYFNKNSSESEIDTEGQFRHNNNSNTMRPVSFVHSYVNSGTSAQTWKVQIRCVSGSSPYSARIYGGAAGDSLISAVEYDLS